MIAESTDWIITALPAVDRNCVDQFRAHCFILSTMDEKRSFFFLPKCSGKPRYLPTPPSFSMPRSSFTLFRVSTGVLLENEMEDFSVLIC